MNSQYSNRGLIVVITGRPGIGKTTVFTKVLTRLKQHNLIIGGIVCPEVRSGTVRVGFKIRDLMSGEEGWLARTSIECPNGLRVGRYCVVLDDSVNVGVNALSKALRLAHVIGIDEVGPMELRVRELRDAIINVLKNPKVVVAVTHWRLNDYEILQLLRGAIRYEVNLINRNSLPEVIASTILSKLT